jgi:hypothetical protein
VLVGSRIARRAAKIESPKMDCYNQEGEETEVDNDGSDGEETEGSVTSV